MNMRERIKPTRSGLFAIELLIAVGVFSLCAAICVGLFVRSEVISQESDDLNRAVNAARSAAECFKAAGGDLDRTAELTGGVVKDGKLQVVYDGRWQLVGDCGTEVDTVFLLEIENFDFSVISGPNDNYARASLRIVGPLGSEALMKENLSGPEAILTWSVAALEVAS